MMWNSTQGASEFGVSRETLLRALRQSGVETEARKEYSTGEIHRALAGDLKASRVRKLRVEAELLEIEKAAAEGRLLEPDVVSDRIQHTLGTIAGYLRAAEVELARQANPSDPEIARRAISEWAKKFWPIIRQKQSEESKA